MEPTPVEYIAAHGILLTVFIILLFFAVLGIFATVEEIRFRIGRRRYRRASQMAWGTKWEKTSRGGSRR
uniref:Uncharacterized protein n=1 Tax=Streptomyces phage Scarif TaxID=3158858 RepID=A0AAU7GWW3_9CAUD